MDLLLCDSQNDPTMEASRVDALLERRVDGLLFVACDSRRSAETLIRAHTQVAVVQVDRFVPGVLVDFVGTDNELGVRLALDHLRGAGRSRFAFVSSKPVDSTAQVRLECYQRELDHIDPLSAGHVLLGDYSVEWGREAARRLLHDGPLPDAIVCGADVIALGVNAALADHGVRVPQDVAVTGFDDITFASLSSPALTTLRQPADEIGAGAVRLLRDRMVQPSQDPVRRLLAPALMVRGSTVARG